VFGTQQPHGHATAQSARWQKCGIDFAVLGVGWETLKGGDVETTAAAQTLDTRDRLNS
jgi:hypothetical protein